MAKKKPKQTAFERKVATIRKLKEAGATTEKQLQSISLEQMLALEDVTIEDMRELLEVQRQVKAHSLYRWLCAEEEAPPETAAEEI